MSVTDSGDVNKRHKVSASALGQPSSTDHPLNPMVVMGRESAGAAEEDRDLVCSSVGGGNAHPLGATMWDRRGLGSTESDRSSGLGPLGSAATSTSPETAPPGQEPQGQRLPNPYAPRVSRLHVGDSGNLCGA